MKKNTLLDKLMKETGKSREEILPTLTHIYVQLVGISGESGKFGSAKIPLEYNDLFLFNSPVREGQPTIYKALESYVISLKRLFKNEDDEPVKNLYFWSENKGNGKTSTAAALLNEFMFVSWLASIKFKTTMLQPPAYFLDVNSFQTMYNRFTRNGVAREVTEEASLLYFEEMDIAKEAPLLVMDDIGVRSASEAFRADLHDIINYRMVKGLPTIYTSNLPIEAMKEVFDERLFDRMRDKALVFKFEGNSRRGIKK